MFARFSLAALLLAPLLTGCQTTAAGLSCDGSAGRLVNAVRLAHADAAIDLYADGPLLASND